MVERKKVRKEGRKTKMYGMDDGNENDHISY
jgi:hypothetical protein